MANEKEYLAVNTSGCINIIYSDDQEMLMIGPKSYSDEDYKQIMADKNNNDCFDNFNSNYCYYFQSQK